MLPLTPQPRRLSRRGGNRTHDLRLIRTPLSPLSYAPAVQVGPEGFEPTPTWLKARDAAVTPRPYAWSGVSVSIDVSATSFSSLLFGVPVVALRVELSATWLSARYGQPALDYRGSQVGMVGLEPTTPCSQGTRDSRFPTSRQSERSDLNRRSRGPRPRAIPGFATF